MTGQSSNDQWPVSSHWGSSSLKWTSWGYLSVRDLLRLIRAMKSPELEHRLHIELLVRHNCTHSRFPTQAEYKRPLISLCDARLYPNPNPKEWLQQHFTKAGQAWVYQNPLREVALSHHLRNPQKRVFPVRILNRKEDYHWWISYVIELRDGRLVSSAEYDDLMRVWDLSDPSRARCEILDGWSTRRVTCLAELPDGRVVSGNRDKVLTFWDLNQPDGIMRQVGTRLCSSRIYDIAALSDGRLAVASSYDKLEVLNLSSAPKKSGNIELTGPKIELTGHKKPVTCVKELRDKRLVSCSDDNTLKIWDLEQNPGKECVATLEGHSGAVNCVAELPDGKLISGSDDKTLRVWNLKKPEGKQYEFSLEGNAGIRCLSMLPNGLVASGGRNEEITIWDLSAPCKQRCVGSWLLPPLRYDYEGDNLCSLITRRNGQVVIGSGSLQVWDLDVMIDGAQCFRPEALNKRLNFD